MSYVHRAITAGLRLRNMDVLTAQEDNRRNTSDDQLLDRATELDRVMFSQDEDMLIEAQRCQKQDIPFAGVIYAHQLRITIGTCVANLKLIAKAAEPEDLINRVEYLPF